MKLTQRYLFNRLASHCLANSNGKTMVEYLLLIAMFSLLVIAYIPITALRNTHRCAGDVIATAGGGSISSLVGTEGSQNFPHVITGSLTRCPLYGTMPIAPPAPLGD